MKYILISLILLGLCSCSQEHDPSNVQGVLAVFTPVIDSEVTRTVNDTWLGTEVIGVAAFAVADGAQVTSKFHQYTPNGMSGTHVQLVPASGEDAIYYPANGDAVTFTAFSPYPSVSDISGGYATLSGNTVTYNLSKQSTATDVTGKLDFMHYPGSDKYSQKHPVATLNFKHKLSRVVIRLTRGSDHLSLTGSTASINGVFTSVSGNILTGAVTPSGSGNLSPFRVTNTVTAVTFCGMVAPQNSSSSPSATSRTLSFTINGKVNAVELPQDFVAGQSYEISTVYTEQGIRLTGVTIAPWDNVNNESNIGQDMPEDWDGEIDWAKPVVFDGESNSYIVPPSGQLIIPVSRAATFSATAEGAGHPTLDTNEEFYAKLYWADAMNVVAESDLIPIVAGPKGYLLVKTGTNSGNAVVGIQKKNSDDTYTTLWSWHVWVTDYVPTGIWMDRNLGATSNTAPSSTTDVSSLGLFYQWGRKDPFPGSTTLASSSGANPSWWTVTTSSTNSVAESIQKPTTHIIGWTGSNGGRSWEPTSKSIYDPCPIGYRVPEYGVNGWGTISGTTEYGWLASVTNYVQYNASYGGYYPAAGLRDYKTGVLRAVGDGVYWNATAEDGGAHCLTFYSSTFYQGDVIPCASGISVRCRKE